MMLKRFLCVVCCLSLMAVLPAAAQQSEVCEQVIGSGDSRALLSLYTDSLNRIVLLISGGDGGDDALTTFRANGVNESGLKFDGSPVTDYFTRTPVTIAGAKEVIYTPIKTAAPEIGKQLTFNKNGEKVYVEWKTSKNTNAYAGGISFSYTYGRTCPKLATPVLSQMGVDSVPVFTTVSGATSYLAKVYLGSVCKYRQYIQPGNVLHFRPLQDATYQVTLTAHADGVLDSDESAPLDWTLQAADIVIGSSEYCSSPIGSGNSLAYLSWQTLENGDLEITISGDEGTCFRSNGLAADGLAGFSVSGAAAATYFTRQYGGDRTKIYTLHLMDSALRPALGEPITFSGTVEWRTALNSNAYGSYSFSYTYGSVCPGLETPVIDNISSGKVITIANPDPLADYYKLYIYRGELLLGAYTVQPGDSVPFAPTATYSYTVYAQACSSHAGRVPSEMSEPYTWRLRAEETEEAMSTLCGQFVSANDGGVYLTAETDDDGRILFTLSGAQHPVWRSAGLDRDIMTIAGGQMSTYFSVRADYEGDSVMILRPNAAGTGTFYPGDKVAYSGNVEWSIIDGAGTATSRWTSITFTYVYGSTCTVLLPRLVPPVIDSVSAEGQVVFAPIEHAGSYQAKVLDEDADEMIRQQIASGDTLLREQAILHPFTYYVSLRAMPADAAPYRPSLWSDALVWNPSYRTPDEPEEPEDPEDEPEEDALEEVLQKGISAKVFYEGQIYIVRSGVVYTLLGERVTTYMNE